MDLVNKPFQLFRKYFYVVIKEIFIKNNWLTRSFKIFRRLIFMGPLNSLIIRFHQTFNKNETIPINQLPLFPKLRVDTVVKSLNESGYSPGAVLPEESLNKILQFCEKTYHDENFRHWNPHKELEVINDIAHNVKIIQIAREYLGAEPILWQTELKMTNPESLKQQQTAALEYPTQTHSDEMVFHNDLLDCKSLTVFVYLSDVDFDCGPHVLIEATHKNKSLKELTCLLISHTQARKIYGERVKTILGKKGTMFFEEVSSYHSAAEAIRRKKRIILKIDYVLQRKVPSDEIFSILKSV